MIKKAKPDDNWLPFFEDDKLPWKGAKVVKSSSVKARMAAVKAGTVKPRKKKKKSGPQPITRSVPDRRDQLAEIRAFFTSVPPGKKPIYIGIDPGVDGAVALFHPTKPGVVLVVDLPTVSLEVKGKKTKTKKAPRRNFFDWGVLWEMWRPAMPFADRIIVALERGHARPLDTGVTGFAVGVGYGMWPLFFVSHGIRYEEYTPQLWKARMGLQGEDKERSRLMAQRLFPKALLFRVGDHNRAEACLLVAFMKRELGLVN